MQDLPVLSVALPLVLHLLSLMTLWGCLLFLRYPGQTAAEGLEPWCRRLCGWALAGAALGQGLWLGGVAASMAGGDMPYLFDPDRLRLILSASQFGQLWLLRTGLLAVTALILWQRPGRRPLAVELLPWAGALLLSLALSGHAAAAEGSRRWLLPVLALHLAAAGAWVGSLPPLAKLAGQGMSDALRQSVFAYRRFGAAAVLALLLSGLAAAALLSGGALPSGPSFWTDLLTVKAILVLLMLGLGAANRFLWAERRPARLHLAVLAEYAVAAAVITAAGLLAQTAPPG